MRDYKAKVGKCEVVIEHLIHVRIEGEKREPGPEDDLPLCPDDGGLVDAFMEYRVKNGHFEHRRTALTSGGGVYSAYFTPSHFHFFQRWFEQEREKRMPDIMPLTADIWSYLQGERTWDETQAAVEDFCLSGGPHRKWEIIREPFDESRVVEGPDPAIKNCYVFRTRKVKKDP